MAKMKLGRRLTEGVGAWLMFEFACDRSGVFSEKYLCQPIGQILAAISGNRVIAEHRHQPLAEFMRGSGRRPEIDFAVCDPYPHVRIAVESKWIGKTKPPVSSIVWDILRLEMLANEYDAQCFFMLGGKKRSLDAYFASEKFSGPVGNTNKKILRTDSNSIHNFDITPEAHHRVNIMREIFGKYQAMKFPLKIPTNRYTPFPAVPKANQYQVITWSISSRGRKRHMYPGNSKHYAQ